MYRSSSGFSALFAFCLFLSACAGPNDLVNVNQDVVTQPNDGFLLTSFDTDIDSPLVQSVPRIVNTDVDRCLEFAPLSTEQTFRIGGIPGLPYPNRQPRLVKMSAGKYALGRVTVYAGSTHHTTVLKPFYIFDIKPGTITYIGDIRLMRGENALKVEVLDDDFKTIEVAQKQFANIFSKNRYEKILVKPFYAPCTKWPYDRTQ